MAYTTIIFGNYPSGSQLTFDATNIQAKQVIGTVKQMTGKRLVQRSIVARNVWDWSINVSGIFTGSNAEIEDFKDAIYQMQGDKQYYYDGVGSHTGSYLIENDGFSVDENPDNYDNDVIVFTLNLIQYNQA